MKCLNCGTEFISKREDAKFDKDSCRKAYARKSDIKADNVSEIKEDVRDNIKSDKPSFTPNWKRQFKSKREGLLAAMVMLGENSSLDGQVFHLGNTSWEAKKGKLIRIA